MVRADATRRRVRFAVVLHVLAEVQVRLVVDVRHAMIAADVARVVCPLLEGGPL
jgi:hypothetical protein